MYCIYTLQFSIPYSHCGMNPQNFFIAHHDTKDLYLYVYYIYIYAYIFYMCVVYIDDFYLVGATPGA